MLDTEAPLGRYALDLARIHGHLCDRLTFAFVALREALLKLFPQRSGGADGHKWSPEIAPVLWTPPS